MRAAFATLLFDVALLVLDPILLVLIAFGLVAAFRTASAIKACMQWTKRNG